MLDSPWIWIILAVLAGIVTIIRASSAAHEGEERQRADQDQKKEMERKLHDIRSSDSALSFSTGIAAMSLDRSAGRLTCVSDAVPNGKLDVALDDIAYARPIDRVTEFKECQELERYHSGVDRASLYNPYGKHKNREVKAGHEAYELFRNRTVYGVTLEMKDGKNIEIPFRRGDMGMFWTEDANYTAFKGFLSEVNEAIRRQKGDF